MLNYKTPPFGQIHITLSKFDEICPLAIPDQISTISMHIPSLVKISPCLLKLSSRNEKNGWTDVQLTDRWTDRHTDIQCGALWCSGKASDSRSIGTGFDPH